MEAVDKKCSKCQTVKSFSEFGKNSKTKDLYKAWCKCCNNEYMKQYRDNTPGLRQKERQYGVQYMRDHVKIKNNCNLVSELIII